MPNGTPDQPQSLAIFTICSNNYLPQARILLASATRHHPQAQIFLCLADQKLLPGDARAAYPENAEIVTLDQLPIGNLPDFTFRYDILELNTAAKPFMFLYLTEQREFDQVIYFDPDIEIFANLTSVTEALDAGASLVLTPHICEPSEVGRATGEIEFLLAGSYNLGFLAVRQCPETAKVLHWWARHLRYDCIVDTRAGLFVDQKFIDLVPSLAGNCFISRDISLNVAHWNITQRLIEGSPEGWTVNGRPLTFFHFSGFNPTNPSRLSRHGPVMRVAAGTALRDLAEDYASRLLASGYLQASEIANAYGKFASGIAIPPVVRKLYRTRHKLWHDNPFETFEEILHLPDPETSPAGRPFFVTHLMRCLYEELGPYRIKLDLQSAEGVRTLVNWYIDYAGSSFAMDWRLVAPVEQRTSPLPAAPADVSLIGYFSASTGVGEAGRRTLANLNGIEGLRCEALDINAAETQTGSGRLQIFHVNADQLPLVMPAMRPHLPRAAYRIAVPFWELETLPEPWHRAFEGIDEIWASSRFIQKMLQKHLKQPVIHIPLASPPIAPLPGGRAAFGLPAQKFLFFTAFDFLSFMERKNPLAAIAAFKAAFPSGDDTDAALVIKTQGSASNGQALALLQAAIGEDARIQMIDTVLRQDEMISLITACDCVLSLHRSEGFGLMIAEAMHLQKPVIATDYGATTELVTLKTGYPVSYQLIPVPEGAYPFASGQVWADPDIAHAARLMREVQSAPQACGPKIRAAQAYLAQVHSPEKIQAMQLARLRQAGLKF